MLTAPAGAGAGAAATAAAAAPAAAAQVRTAAAVSIALRKVHRGGSTGWLRAKQTLIRRKTARGRPADEARVERRLFSLFRSVHVHAEHKDG